MDTSSARRPVAVLNGPNLNLLGEREPAIYGTASLHDIQAMCEEKLQDTGFSLVFEQHNSEGALIEAVQRNRKASALLINAAGYTHTSVALLDALLMVEGPVIEVHLSSPAKRESFRHQSIIAPACQGVIAGFGVLSYRLALDAAIALATPNADKT
ncbi:MAG: type II 3-dehydroquinate dehydratase [Parvularcula sp.]|jgi:3-dehydroquinate dehydratase-2|nr:type II 3-dehydroquinate dehydratase [Parvularcula sp.]